MSQEKEILSFPTSLGCMNDETAAHFTNLDFIFEIHKVADMQHWAIVVIVEGYGATQNSSFLC